MRFFLYPIGIFYAIMILYPSNIGVVMKKIAFPNGWLLVLCLCAIAVFVYFGVSGCRFLGLVNGISALD